jgi:hypothetical protein
MNEYIEKIDKIIEWAGNKKGKPFDTSFCQSVKDFIENSEYGEPTDNQKSAIDNIIERFKVRM